MTRGHVARPGEAPTRSRCQQSDGGNPHHPARTRACTRHGVRRPRIRTNGPTTSARSRRSRGSGRKHEKKRTRRAYAHKRVMESEHGARRSDRETGCARTWEARSDREGVSEKPKQSELAARPRTRASWSPTATEWHGAASWPSRDGTKRQCRPACARVHTSWGPTATATWASERKAETVRTLRALASRSVAWFRQPTRAHERERSALEARARDAMAAGAPGESEHQPGLWITA